MLKCVLFTFVNGDALQLILPYGTKFIKNSRGKLIYEGGEIDSWLGVDEDTFNVFTMTSYNKELGYHKIDNYFCLALRRELGNRLRVLQTDSDLLDMSSV